MFPKQKNSGFPKAHLACLKMINQRLLLSCFLLSILFSSCIPFKDIPYLQETGENSYEVVKPSTVYKIKPADLLNIKIKFVTTSSKDYFEAGNANIGAGGGQGTGSPLIYFSGFMVDQEGTIDLPQLGKLSVAGKPTGQIALEIEEKLKSYVKFNDVDVKLANFRVTLLGEVGLPGVQYIYEEQYTLLNAIANAGGLTDFSNRKKIRLIRETEKGVKTIWFDLTDPKSLSSEYFYLLPNDTIYVEPLKAKINRANIQNASIGLSVVSILVTLITLFSR